MNNRVTILICGKASSGKTTFATVLAQEINKLAEDKARVIHNAQTVKTIAEACFSWDKEKDAKGRQLLLDITSAGYNYDPFHWEKETELMFRRYKSIFEDQEILIIPDWRYKSTYDFFSKYGRVIPVHIERFNQQDGTHSNHSSENDFKKFPKKFSIVNNGDIEDLVRFSKMFIEVEGLCNV